MSFQGYAWLACLFFAGETIVGKLTIRHSVQNPWFLNFIWALLILIFTLPIALYHSPTLPHAWGNLLVAGIFYAAAGILYVLALSFLDVSVLSPLFNIRTALSVILSATINHEVLSNSQYGLIALMLLCGVFVSMDERLSIRSFLTPGIGVALAEMLTLALMAVFIKRSMQENEYWQVTLWLSVIAQVIFLATVPLFIHEVRSLRVTQSSYIVVLSLCGFFGSLAAYRAYAENVGITAAILSVPLPAVIAAMMAWKFPALLEKHSLKVYAVRMVATIIMFAAAILLGI